jgi:uncharacterized oligopeptide transporter (OPT) family protein
MAASNARAQAQVLPLVERDLPIKWVGIVMAVTLALIALLLWQFIAGSVLAAHAPVLITRHRRVRAGVGCRDRIDHRLHGRTDRRIQQPRFGRRHSCGRRAAFVVLGVVGRASDLDQSRAMVAYALFATGIVFGIATIANDNLQDLKTGQLVGATPWRQQVALVFGVIFGALIIPPVLEPAQHRLRFRRHSRFRNNALAAPQAALISALAEGVLGGNLNLRMIEYGALFGAFVIAADALLGRGGRMRLPPLAIGLGIYLPMSATLPVVIGAVTGYYYDRWADRTASPEFARRIGVLMATGMIVGESLFGVLYAGIVVVSGKSAPFALVGDDFATPALIGGAVVFSVLIGLLYRRTMRAVVGHST